MHTTDVTLHHRCHRYFSLWSRKSDSGCCLSCWPGGSWSGLGLSLFLQVLGVGSCLSLFWDSGPRAASLSPCLLGTRQTLIVCLWHLWLGLACVPFLSPLWWDLGHRLGIGNSQRRAKKLLRAWITYGKGICRVSRNHYFAFFCIHPLWGFWGYKRDWAKAGFRETKNFIWVYTMHMYQGCICRQQRNDWVD